MDKGDLRRLAGSTLSEDLKTEHGAMLLPAGTVFRDEQIEDVGKHKLQGSHQSTRENEVTALIDVATGSIQEMFQYAIRHERIPAHDVRQQVVPLVVEASVHPNIFRLFDALKAKDNYTYRHNVAVGVIATLIGRWLNLENAELSALSMAASVHDVGKVRVSNEILNKPGRLTPEEYAVMKNHTVFGYEIIKNTVSMSHRQALAALQHHEREDGTGYPLGLTSDKIDLFGKIIAVADVFHAMSSRRAYQEVSPFYRVMSEMEEMMFQRKLDLTLSMLFLGKMMNRLIGCEAQLNDGRQGRIVLINGRDPVHPLLQIGDEFVDLSAVRTLQIDTVIPSDD